MANEKDSRARETEEEKFIFSTADTCNFFQISRETLSTWQKKGAPKAGRGKWNIKALMEWRFSGKKIESPTTRKLKAEADLKEAKAAQEALSARVEALEKGREEDAKQRVILSARMEGKQVALSADALAKLSVEDVEKHVAALPVTVPLNAKTPANMKEKAAEGEVPEELRQIALNCGVDPEIFKK